MMTDKKQETAKDILDRFIHHPRHLNLEEAALKFAQEIADKAWEAAIGGASIKDCACPQCTKNAARKSTFMKSLFPLKEI